MSRRALSHEHHHLHAANSCSVLTISLHITHLIPFLPIKRSGTLAISGYTAVRVRRMLRPIILREFKEADAKADHPMGEQAAEMVADAVSGGLELAAGVATYLTISSLLSTADYLANGTEAERIAARSRCVCVFRMHGGQKMKSE